MSYNYIATLQKSTKVVACATGNLTSKTSLNLIVAKNSHFEIFLVTSDGLKLVKEVEINGEIAVLKLFRPAGKGKDSIFILTQKYQAMILDCKYNEETSDFVIITKAYGSVRDPIGRKTDNDIQAVIDPKAQIIGMTLYVGLFKIILLQNNRNALIAYNLRMTEMLVHNVEFLYGCSTPTLIVIHQDENGRHMKVHEINLREKEFVRMIWKHDEIETEATILIPIPAHLGGTIVIGQKSIVYYSCIQSFYVATASTIIEQSTITCYARLDKKGLRYLLGNMSGKLLILVIETETNVKGEVCVKDLKVEMLGEVSIPKCITYLDNGVLFIGSCYGDSQLVKLNTFADENGVHVVPIETFTNLGPIVDMCIVDLGHQGNEKIITCSGWSKDGTVRIIRNVIEVQKHACIDLPGVKGLWALQMGSDDSQYDNTLVLSFVGHTTFLTLTGEEVEETEIDGLLSDEQTFYCANVNFNQIIQVTPTTVCLIKSDYKSMASQWSPPVGRRIAVVAGNQQQLVCASGCDIYYLEIENEKLIETSTVQLGYEIACLDISPLDEGASRSDIVAVGLWTDISVCLLKVPTLRLLYTKKLDGDFIPRSILVKKFEGINYLLCALGDGSMFYFVLDKNCGQLTDQKKVTLGRTPAVLKTFSSSSVTNVLACCDLPTIIYPCNHKLVFSNIDLKEVIHVCSIKDKAYSGSLALATKNSVIFGTINKIQKWHIRTMTLGESPKRMAYQESSGTFGILTVRTDIQNSTGLKPARPSASTHASKSTTSDDFTSSLRLADDFNSVNGQEMEISNLLVVDKNSFEVYHAHQFIQTEAALSLMSAKLGNDPNLYYIVGTAIICPEQDESKVGRIIVFHFSAGKFHQIAQKEIKGSCFSLIEFNGKVVASINNTVQLFEWTDDRDLRLVCSDSTNICVLYLKTKGDFILVGDLIRSMQLLQYNDVEEKFEVIAQDYEPQWMTAIEILNDESFLGAEINRNLFVGQRDSAAENDEERQQLSEVSLFHIGDCINVLRRGSVSMIATDEIKTPMYNVIFYGTVSGAIGLFAQIPSYTYDYLNSLQEELTETLKSVGKIEHKCWRSFRSELIDEPSKGFIDGDLIEKFLFLSQEQKLKCFSKLQISENGQNGFASINELEDAIDDLTRVHRQHYSVSKFFNEDIAEDVANKDDAQDDFVINYYCMENVNENFKELFNDKPSNIIVPKELMEEKFAEKRKEPKLPIDSAVLVFHDITLRESDVNILRGPYWLNDQIIAFYFQYLESKIYSSFSQQFAFILPSVTQLLKMSQPENLDQLLVPLQLDRKELIFFPINDNESDMAGGTHWSLLVFSRPENQFYSFDSFNNYNKEATNRMFQVLINGLNCSTATFNVQECTLQDNAYDCGIYVLAYTELVCEYFITAGFVKYIPILPTLATDGKRQTILNIIDNLKSEVIL